MKLGITINIIIKKIKSIFKAIYQNNKKKLTDFSGKCLLPKLTIEGRENLNKSVALKEMENNLIVVFLCHPPTCTQIKYNHRLFLSNLYVRNNSSAS